MIKPVLSDRALDQMFRNARSFNGWLEDDVSDLQLQGIVDLMKMAPTSANCQP
ncbi:MAG TPA: nitroreductase family protein, partial [Rhizobiales bacterium]|nr:nitroreductase family protein [Hyphomicrobiales bacterium]